MPGWSCGSARTASPVHRHSSVGASASPREQRHKPSCGLILFLHIEKTGGTSIANALRRGVGDNGSRWQSVDHQCLHERIKLEHWAARNLHSGGGMDAVEASIDRQVSVACARKRLAPSLCNRTSRPWPFNHPSCASGFTIPPLGASRFTITFHSNNWPEWQALIPVLPELRARYVSAGCTFTAFTILREPRALLLSFWSYFHHHNWTLAEAAKAASELQASRLSMRTLNSTRALLERRECPDYSLLGAARRTLASLDVVGFFEELPTSLRRVQTLSGFDFQRAGFRPSACHGSCVRAMADSRLAKLSSEQLALATAATRCDKQLYSDALECEQR